MGWVAIFLYFAGVVLVLAEFLVPGGICGTVGGIFVVVSGVLGCMAAPDHAVFIIVGEVIGIVASIVIGIHLLPKSRLGKSLILVHSQNAEAGWVAAESDESLVGQQGEVVTALRPAGTIIVGGKRIDAVSDGQFINKGAAVRVTEVHGSRVVVEQTEAEKEKEKE